MTRTATSSVARTAGERCLIVNADDFGLSNGVNAGIIEAHEHGIVTAASLMVRWPAAEAAAAYASEHPSLDLGLHIDLGEWTCKDGTWEPLYEVVATDDAAAVSTEVHRQLGTFRQLTGRNPSHLDSHQHVHRDEPALTIIRGIARELRIPLRHVTPGIAYWGQFYGQSDTGESYPELVSPNALVEILASLPNGVTELGCHPARGHDIAAMYSLERELELHSLCDKQAKEAIVAQGIRLCSFAGLNRDPV
jgi:predicted glycoside hydrolase/deacetylase ChbG (UPF0249 family)